MILGHRSRRRPSGRAGVAAPRPHGLRHHLLADHGRETLGDRTALPGRRGHGRGGGDGEAILDRVNAERDARGLPPLTSDEELAAVARGWNVEMARRGQLKHQDIRAPLERESLSDLDGVGVGVGVGVGKNIFQATGPVPAGAMHAGWMRSDGHRVNVLNPGWDRLGVAVLCAENGSVWATREFGRSAGADLPEIAEETPPAESVVPPEDDGPRCG